ncbi:nucleotidyltransferase family protein [Micromonospora sp. R77]|uniref:nucleotidyltransferase family protein n=1 Tax=Micromonospora sp. R77 TaxID=2925836 RepID=UPI001F60197C|nr:nucleotidyltransferase family protein [Micromonospora sp. R77]MCI4061279.1 nucleotidyltransferase family protein [Micromonospora sp. R77]
MTTTTGGLALRCLALDALAVSTSDLLRRQGVDSVLLKGAGLARRLGVDRLYADVDLLVAPHTITAAQTALHAAGYRPTLPPDLYDVAGPWHEQPWSAPGPLPLAVDLHRGFAGVGDPDALWRSLRAGAGPLDLAGGHVLVPDESGAALLAALHAATPGGVGKPAQDLARALTVLPPDAWDAAGRLAADCAATAAFTVGLRVLPTGRALADRLGLPTTPDRRRPGSPPGWPAPPRSAWPAGRNSPGRGTASASSPG